MNINEILKGRKCNACGKEHKCPIENVYIESDATKHLSHLTENYENILIVADENTYSACGENTEKALANKIKNRVIFGKCGIQPFF